MFTFFREKLKKLHIKGLSKNPFFWFGATSLVLFSMLFFSASSLASPGYPKSNEIIFFNSFFKNTDNLTSNDLFFDQNAALALETPDLKIIQNNSLSAVSTTSVLTTQTLGDIFGGQEAQRKSIEDYVVQPGDTAESVAQSFGISLNTLLWANDITKNTSLKVGQTLTILPVSGLSYIVRSGDTLGQITKTYKGNIDDIIAFNNLANEGDIFIGDSLIIPDGVMPAKAVPLAIQVPLADNFFIYPAEGQITQGLHYYNAVDLANKCGTPIYAAASGTIQRAVANNGYNKGMGNYITILHSNGTVTYYGHLQTLFVKSGDKVGTGDRIGLMGRTGNSTGCHAHFEVVGAANPLAKYLVGTVIKYKQ